MRPQEAINRKLVHRYDRIREKATRDANRYLSMTVLVGQPSEFLARLQVLASVLGGAAHAKWWRTEFLTAAGLRFLDRLYPRTSCAAAI